DGTWGGNNGNDMCVTKQCPISIIDGIANKVTPVTINGSGNGWWNDIATIVCATNYELATGSPSTTTCKQTTTTWSTPLPNCIPKRCNVPIMGTNTNVPTYTPDADGESKYSAGTVATYTCKSGYAPKNDDYKLTCQVDGTWNGNV